ncbi:HalOD1 output domain-containing protein [Haladaptatus halobius]|uniref:HalOD1 output domain-containing protein n=1 Tax=Haladaptatus halobius TaxID=2884875 RepID=UPI001D0A5058|nr:HalOD1 output domain-containing protein [Haladaptatus halobius]
MDSENSSHPDGGAGPGWRTEKPLATTIVERLAAHKDVSVDDLEPIYEYIDPDALEALIAPRTDASDRIGGQITFMYAGYHVTVCRDRTIDLEPLGEEEG